MNDAEEFNSKFMELDEFFRILSDDLPEMNEVSIQVLEDIIVHLQKFIKFPKQIIMRLNFMKFESACTSIMKFIIKNYHLRSTCQLFIKTFFEFIGRRSSVDVLQLEANLILSLQKNFQIVPTCETDEITLDDFSLQNAPIAIVDMLELYLNRFTVRNPNAYKAISNLLISKMPQIDKFQIIRCFSLLSPSRATDSWVMIISLIYFIIDQIKSNNLSIFDDKKNDFDKLCSTAFKNATYLLHKSILLNISQNIIQYITLFRSISKKAPLFLDQYFKIIQLFIDSDLSNSDLVEEVIFQNFPYFCYHHNFLMACKSLISRSRSFFDRLIKFYKSIKQKCLKLCVEKALLKLNPQYAKYINVDDIESCIHLSLIVPESKFTDIVDKNSEIALTYTDSISYKNLIIICRKRVDNIHLIENFPAQDIINFFSEYYNEDFKNGYDILFPHMLRKAIDLDNINLKYLVASTVNESHNVNQHVVQELIDQVKPFLDSPIDYNDIKNVYKARAYLAVQDEYVVYDYLLSSFVDLFSDEKYVNIVHEFLKSNKYKIVTFDRILEILKSSDDKQSAIAYYSLQTFDNIREIYLQMPSMIGKDLFSLYKINICKFNEVCKLICGHRDPTRLIFGVVSDYISENDILNINKLFDPSSNEDKKINEEAQEEISSNLPKIVLCCLMNENYLKYRQSLAFIQTHFNKDINTLFDDVLSQIASEILMYLYSEDLNISIRNSLKSHLDEYYGDNVYLTDYLWKSLLSFKNILQSQNKNMKITVLNAIYSIVSHYSYIIVSNYSSQLLFTTMCCLEYHELRNYFFKIWQKFIEKISGNIELNSNISQDLIYPLLMVTLNYDSGGGQFDLNQLIINQIVSNKKFWDINSFIFYEFPYNPKLSFNIDNLIVTSKSYEIIIKLSEMIKNAPPILAKILLKQILHHIKSKNLELYDKQYFVKNIVQYLQSDVPEDIVILAGRCLSYITDTESYQYIARISFNTDQIKEIITHIIRSYLEPLLYDQKLWHYEIACYTISKAVRKFGINFETKFDSEVSKPPIENEIECNNYTPYGFISNFMTKSSPYRFLKSACSVSVSLCRFLFPFLIKEDPYQHELVRKLVTEYFSTPQECGLEMSYFIFSMYVPMCELGINLGQNFGRIRIRVEENLIVKAAIRCQQYDIALRHIYYMKENPISPVTENIYSNLDDSDGLTYIRENNHKNKTSESIILDETASINEKHLALRQMIENGSFQRALSDSHNLYRSNIQDVELTNIMADVSLRMQSWDTMSLLSRQKIINGYEISIVRALTYFVQDEEPLFESEISQIRNNLGKLLQDVAARSSDTISNVSCKFRIIEDLNDAFQKKKSDYDDWMLESSIKTEISEIAISVNCLTLDLNSENQNKNQILKKKSEMLLNLAKICRKNDLFAKAAFYCEKAKTLALQMQNEFYCRCIIERTKLFEANGDYKNAHQMLWDFRKNVNNLDARWHAMFETTLGHTMYLNQFSSLQVIGKIYQNSIKLYDRDATTYYRLARLSDDLVMSKLDDIKNIEVNKLRIDEKFNEVNTTNSTELLTFRKNICNALENYFLAMRYKMELGKEVLPRVFYLFFDIGNLLFSKIKIFEKENQSYQYFSLILFSMFDIYWCYINQLQPFLLSNSIVSIISRFKISDEFKKAWLKLIEISVKSYNHHTYWFLSYLINQDREKVTDEILQLFDNYIGHKYIEVTKALKTFSMSDEDKISENIKPCQDAVRGKNLMVPITYCFNSKSQSLPVILGMSEKVEILQSLMHPKKIILESSDGRKLKFLLKKDRDMRKDMRVMELFTFINSVFMRDHKCKQRNFFITPYSVICLSEQISIMEWVKDAITFKGIFDNDIYSDFLSLRKEWENTEDPRKRQEIMKKSKLRCPHPTHSWYCQNFVNPAQWFHAEMNYIRSTAAYSMIGRIIGLGDRHLENILINNKNGQVVHIDFDSIFDDNKKRDKHPETVSFRLTNCIKDGLGVTGIEGTFSSSCVIAHEALKAKRPSLCNILHSFVYDPLIDMNWNNPSLLLEEIERRISLQSNDRNTVISTNYAVMFMNIEATSESNLLKMYSGWLPFV